MTWGRLRVALFFSIECIFFKNILSRPSASKNFPPKMSARKAINLLEQQIADHKAHRRERYERIFDTYADEADRDAAIERDRAQGLAPVSYTHLTLPTILRV